MDYWVKTYCKNIDILSEEHLSYAYEEFGKRGRKNDPKFASFFERDLDDIFNEVRIMVHERKLVVEPIHYFLRTEPITGKTRKIGCECSMQQYLDHVAELALEELLQAKVGFHQCASIKGKGQHHALRYIKKWVRSRNSRFYVKLDVKKYYNSIDREKLMGMLSRDVKNDDLLWLIEALISTHEQGLSIGSRLSQRLANYYLADAYRRAYDAVKYRKSRRSGEEKRVRLVSHVLTYMDDWLLISKNARDLKMAVRRLEKYLKDCLSLSIKRWKVCVVDKEPIDMVGYVFRRTWTAVRSGIFLRARRAFSAARRALFIKPHQAARCIAYWGWFKASSTRRFRERYGLEELLTKCKDAMALNQMERNWHAENLQQLPFGANRLLRSWRG